MFTSVTPDTTPPTITAKTPAPGSAGINVGTPVTATFSEFLRTSTINASTFVLKDSGGNAVPATVTLRPVDERGDPDAPGRTPIRSDVHRDGEGRRRRRHRLRRESVGGRRQLVVHDRSFASSATGRLVVDEPVRELSHARSCATKGSTRSRRWTRRCSLRPCSRSFDVVLLGDIALNATQVSTLTNWVNGGGNLIAMHPDKQLAGCSGLTRCRHDTRERVPEGRHGTRPGRGHRRAARSSTTAPPTATRSTAPRRVATLYSNATTATATPPSRCDRSARAAARRPRSPTTSPAPSSTRARAIPPGRGRSATASSGIRPDDLFYGAKTGDVQPDWLDTEQDRDPAGRRAAAAARQPDHADGARQAAAAALLVPAARQQSGGRDERRRPRARRHGGTAALRPLQGSSARPAASSPTGSASARPRTSIPTAR